jgi:Na+/proline symporter
MHLLDWIVLVGTLLAIVSYGVYKTRSIASVEAFLTGGRELKWWTIGLSIMATQASAITFLSTPGKAYQDGMGFAQFYFGLPIAMVLLCAFVLPHYYRLKVYTAYEFLEQRFGVSTRTLTASFFLCQRGLSAGITIFAPSIILSSILGWSLQWTTLTMGGVVIFYTFMGGTNAVSQTQKQQMILILSGMVLAAFIAANKLPSGVSLNSALHLAGDLGKLEVVDTHFSFQNRYNIWTGMLASVFLFLSYFGADQSQVQRYLSGRTLRESRMGLLFNGVIKVPMQLLVLFTGILVFSFYQFERPPLHFNESNLSQLRAEGHGEWVDYYEIQHEHNYASKTLLNEAYIEAQKAGNSGQQEQLIQQIRSLNAEQDRLESEIKALISTSEKKLNPLDGDYIFIRFVIDYLPVGIVGLILAVIFSAAMSSTASEINALATTTMVDLYRRSWAPNRSGRHYLMMSKWLTLAWGGIALLAALGANLFDNLVEAVNIVGSLFYGSILGVFTVAFFFKSIGGRATFWAAICAELLVIYLYFSYDDVLSYLWLVPIGCFALIILAALFQQLLPSVNQQKQ